MSLPFEEGLESQLIASEILNTAYREFFNSTMECDKDIFGRVFYLHVFTLRIISLKPLSFPKICIHMQEVNILYLLKNISF